MLNTKQTTEQKEKYVHPKNPFVCLIYYYMYNKQ
jgi:hypothetical protein